VIARWTAVVVTAACCIGACGRAEQGKRSEGLNEASAG
jgi:hypothetical protein